MGDGFHTDVGRAHSRGAALTYLREVTRAAHQRLERRLALLDESLTHERYCGILQAMWGFHHPLEEALSNSFFLRDAPGRPRAHRILHDLKRLGINPSGLESCHDLPALGTRSAVLGGVYVLEGSTLGGRVILRHLKAHLGINARCGASFFAGYGQTTGEMWRQTCAFIENGLRPEGQGAAGVSALATFESLEKWLAGRGVLHE